MWYCNNLKDSVLLGGVTDETLKRCWREKIISPNLKKCFSYGEIKITKVFAKSIHNKTYTPKELNNHFSENGNESSCIHLNISSLRYHHEEPHSLISNLKVQTKIIVISESRLKKEKQPVSSIDLKKLHFWTHYNRSQ